ncbi:MAG: DUF1631 family protein [Pseudomonadota bacterium]
MESQSKVPRAFLLAQQLQGLGRTATEDVRKAARTELSTLFSRFLQRLPDVLIDTSRKLLGDGEQRALQDLARGLGTNASRWNETFISNIETQWNEGVRDHSDASDKMLSSAEEAIALATVEMRAESLYRKHIDELKAHLDHVQQMLFVKAHAEALAPATLYRALQDTADTLGWPGTRRRVLFMTFDETVVNGLARLYQAVFAQIDRYVEQAKSLGAEPVEAAPTVTMIATPEFTVPATTAGIQAPAETPKVDPATLSMLMSQASHSSTTGYNDGSLAADLLSLASNEPLADVPADQSWVPLQRMELAGTFLNDSISDPLIPDAMRPQHEAVRFPLVKSALTDSTFFTAVTHPLRSLVNELLLKTATSHVTGNTETRRVAELLQQVLVQFDLAPDFVREAMLTAVPIPQEQIEKFFEMQKQQSQQRRDTVVGEAKRLVIRELELSSFGRDLPQIALKFLNAAWGPLLAKCLLKHGAAHANWKAGLATMDLLIDQIEAREPEQAAPAEWIQLTDKVRSELSASGLDAERVTTALGMLEAARQTRKTLDLRTVPIMPRTRE